MAKIEIRDYYLSQERDYHPLKTALMQSFPTIATGSSLLATMVFIHSQHHACKKSANSDVAACRRTPYRRGVAYPREVSRACDFRAHGLQTSILFLIPFIQFTCLPDCPLLTLGKDRNQRLLSQPRERLSSLKDSKNAVFLLSSEPKKLTRSRWISQFPPPPSNLYQYFICLQIELLNPWRRSYILINILILCIIYLFPYNIYFYIPTPTGSSFT